MFVPGLAREAAAQELLRVALPSTPGATWQADFDNLADCLASLLPNTTYEIWVAKGVHVPYPGISVEPAFRIPKNVAIYGGFAGTEEDRIQRNQLLNLTTLSGAVPQPAADLRCGDPEAGSCFEPHLTPSCGDAGCCTIVCGIFTSCCDTAWDATCVEVAESECIVDYQAQSVVVTSGGGGNRRIDGFTITEGGERSTTGLPDPRQYDYGGGVSVSADGLEDSVRLDVVRCRIVGNSAYNGGGVSITTALPGEPTGPEVAEVQLWSCELLDNLVLKVGGGVYAHGKSRFTIANSVIAGNDFVMQGPLQIDQEAPALYDMVDVDGMDRAIVNSTITRNKQVFLAVHSYSTHPEDFLVANSIIRGNYGHDSEGNLLECGPEEVCEQISATLDIRYCNISAAPATLALFPGSIDADPLFEDAANGNFSLMEGSACLDAGSNALAMSDALDVDDDGLSDTEKGPDLLLKERIRRGSPAVCTPTTDMGAYERQGFCALGDLDSDSNVDGGDLGTLLASWGACSGSPCAADLDCDGEVGGADLGLLLGAWGPGHPRYCGSPAMEAFMLAGEGSDQGDGQPKQGGLSLAELSESMGFATMPAFVSWLTTLPFEEMEFFLRLLG